MHSTNLLSLLLCLVFGFAVHCIPLHPPQRPDSQAWQSLGKPGQTQLTTISLTLHPGRQDELTQVMDDIAINRKQWGTLDSLKEYTAASNDAKAMVEQHLTTHGVPRSSWHYGPLGDELIVQGPVRMLEKVLDTTFYTFRNLQTGDVFIKATEANLPANVAEHVLSVGNLTTFYTMQPYAPFRSTPIDGSLQKRGPQSAPTGPSAPHESPPGCSDGEASFPCIARYYGYDNYAPNPDSASVATIGIGDLWTDSTMHTFVQDFVPGSDSAYLPGKLTLENATAWDDVTKDGFEDALDIEILTAVAHPLKVSTIATKLEFRSLMRAMFVMPQEDRPSVVSLSYGYGEHYTNDADFTELCNLIQWLTFLGTTFVAATGDHGVSEPPADKVTCPPFQVNVPSSCPYTLAVGATTHFSVERAVYSSNATDPHDGWSQGGFSTFHEMPKYQKYHAAHYLVNTSWANQDHFNASNRALPDVAAFGLWIDTLVNGQRYWGAGTSASAPLFAGILALVNAKCKENNWTPIGWPHWRLYLNEKTAFKDITVGGAWLCGDAGFPCAELYDPVTGLGTPIFDGLVQAFGCDQPCSPTEDRGCLS